MPRAKGLAIVAVESNLLGRVVLPFEGEPNMIHNYWPFIDLQNNLQDEKAEIVAVHVGDLDEGGALKFTLRGITSGRLKAVYDHAFRVPSQ